MLTVGILFHLGVDWTLNIPLFEWIFIGSFVVFVYPEDLEKAMGAIRRCVRHFLGPPIDIYFDECNLPSIKLAGVVHRLDLFGTFNIQPACAPLSITPTKSRPIAMTVGGKSISDNSGLRHLLFNLPLLWLVCPFALVPSVASIIAKLLAPELNRRATTFGAVQSLNQQSIGAA